MALLPKLFRFLLIFVIITFVANVPMMGYFPYIHRDECGDFSPRFCGGIEITAILNPIFWLPAITFHNPVAKFENEYYSNDNPFTLRLFHTAVPTEQFFVPIQGYDNLTCQIVIGFDASAYCDTFPNGNTGEIIFQVQLLYWFLLAILIHYLFPLFQIFYYA